MVKEKCYSMKETMKIGDEGMSIVRNFLEPKVIGNQVGLHPLITLLAMFSGLKLLGIVGLFGFPITLIVLNDLGKRGIIKFNINLSSNKKIQSKEVSEDT